MTCKQIIYLTLFRETNPKLKYKFRIGYGEEPVVMVIESGMFYRLPNREFSLEIIVQFASFEYKSSLN